MFTRLKTLFTPDKYKIIVIPSYRTPERVIKKAYNTFNFNHHVVKKIDKKAYLSSLSIADYIVVMCDSTSMISEAAFTGKPIYVAMMKSNNISKRFLTWREDKTVGLTNTMQGATSASIKAGSRQAVRAGADRCGRVLRFCP